VTISEDRLRNTRAWAAARPDMSGSGVIVGAIDELLQLREQDRLYKVRHPDDLAVIQFSLMMRDKMAASRDKGRSGWDDPTCCTIEYLQELLLSHLEKGDPVDVANFCMMLQHRGARVAALQREHAASAQDAARYRWLRELREDDSISVLHWSPMGGLPPDHEEAADERTGAPLHYDQLDAAIDAALAQPDAARAEGERE
jgi:hypothetical protein